MPRNPRVPEGLGETGLAPSDPSGRFPAWQRPVARLLSVPVIAFLRFIGVTNAAIWFGGAFFFTFVGGPVFFTQEFEKLFPKPYNGAAAQFLIQRFFILHYWCAIVAGLHLLAEWLYAGRDLRRGVVALLVGLFVLALAGGVWMQPKLKRLNAIQYADSYRPHPMPTPEERAAAKVSFKRWHGVSMATNLVMIAGLLLFLAHTVRPETSAKSLWSPKFGIDNRS